MPHWRSSSPTSSTKANRTRRHGRRRQRPSAHNVCFTMHGIACRAHRDRHAHLFLACPPRSTTTRSRITTSAASSRYDRAVKEVRDELKELATAFATAPPRSSRLRERAPHAPRGRRLLGAPREIIGEQRCNAEWALRTQLDELTRSSTTSRTNTCASARPTCARSPSGCSRAGGSSGAGDEALAPGRGHDPRRARSLARRRDPLPRAPFALRDDMGGRPRTRRSSRARWRSGIVALHHSRTLIREDEVVIVDGTQACSSSTRRAVLASTGCGRTGALEKRSSSA